MNLAAHFDYLSNQYNSVEKNPKNTGMQCKITTSSNEKILHILSPLRHYWRLARWMRKMSELKSETQLLYKATRMLLIHLLRTMNIQSKL